MGGGGGGRSRGKGSVLHTPALSVKTSRLCSTGLHSRTPLPLCLMAVLAEHCCSSGSKRFLAFNRTTSDAVKCGLYKGYGSYSVKYMGTCLQPKAADAVDDFYFEALSSSRSVMGQCQSCYCDY